MKTTVKQDWIEKARETFRFHRSKLLLHEDWRLEDTAECLNRSLGSISQDITIARWLRTHEKDIERQRSIKDALEFIREKKKKMDLQADV